VKSLNMLKLPVILLGFGGALLLSPACKAQESSPDHFTDTGVQDVYEPGSAKPAAKPAKPAVVQAKKQQTGSDAKVQLAANRSASEIPQPSAQAVADKRKETPKP